MFALRLNGRGERARNGLCTFSWFSMRNRNFFFSLVDAKKTRKRQLQIRCVNTYTLDVWKPLVDWTCWRKKKKKKEIKPTQALKPLAWLALRGIQGSSKSDDFVLRGRKLAWNPSPCSLMLSAARQPAVSPVEPVSHKWSASAWGD